MTLRTNRKNNLFTPGDDLVIEVENRSGKPAFIELIGTGLKGEKVVLTKPGLSVAAGETYRLTESKGKPLKVKAGEGREQLTLFAGEKEFTPGEVIKAKMPEGYAVADRVVHAWDRLEQAGGRWTVRPAAVMKKTIGIETR